MGRELKKYQIRATKRPAKNPLLSSTVVVRNEEGSIGYCYVNFSRELVEAVGKSLPGGVTEDDPAFLRVVYYAATKIWLVQAQHESGGKEILLWKTAEKPTWLNFYKVSK